MCSQFDGHQKINLDWGMGRKLFSELLPLFSAPLQAGRADELGKPKEEK